MYDLSNRTCLFILYSFPQQEQNGQQHTQPCQIDSGDEQGGFQHAQNRPELLLGGPFRLLLPRAVIGRLRGLARLSAVGAQHRRRADIAHVGDGAAIVLKIVVLPHLSYRWQTT